MTDRATTRKAPASAAGAARRALEANPYGLTLPELRAEINRCMARGFELWEIRLRFTSTRKDTLE
ncbi:hypothetical protein ABZ690_00845 [Streptomyces sp. NPDC006967]|uniref:hypothetical protein n=1 Tax=Streptomyces sp. NPDC006967 TaxID=3156906 RepID=UPI0033CABBFB